MYATLAQKGLFLLKVFKVSLLTKLKKVKNHVNSKLFFKVNQKLKKVKNHVNSKLFFKVNQNLQTKLKFTLSQG